MYKGQRINSETYTNSYYRSVCDNDCRITYFTIPRRQLFFFAGSFVLYKDSAFSRTSL